MISRTILFVPGNKEKMLAKSLASGADALVWDLEDAVALSEKDLARATVGNALRNLDSNAKPVYVRINSVAAGMLEDDLTAIVHRGLYGVMLSKAESPAQVRQLEQALNVLEKTRGLADGGINIELHSGDLPWGAQRVSDCQ